MIVVMFFLGVLVLWLAGGGVASVVLSFTSLRHSWIVIASALPALLVGACYTGAFLVGGWPMGPGFIVSSLLLFLGAFPIIRWFYNRA